LDETGRSFYREAKLFSDFTAAFQPDSGAENYRLLLEHLLRLYAAGVKLTLAKIDDPGTVTDNALRPTVDLKKYNDYWEVFNPFSNEAPVQGSLSDDLADIYCDLQEEIRLYEQAKYREAIGNWTFNFQIHWGSHAVDAIRALHYLVYRELRAD
jgi:hypothetical protein